MNTTPDDYGTPARASWILLLLTCGLSLIPVFGFASWLIAAPMLIAAFALAIVVLSRGGTGQGILLLLCSAVIAPVFVFCAPFLATALGIGAAAVATAPLETTAATSSWSNLTVNNRKTITRRHDGVTRKLETTADVELQNGQITTFPKAALVKIWETRGAEQRQAELRENAGRLELWTLSNGSFQKGSPEDAAWLKEFLSDFTTPHPP